MYAVGSGSSEASRSQPILNRATLAPVPKLDLSATRNALSNTSFGSSFGAGTATAVVAGGGAFEEGPASARSFGEDFDIQPPAPNRRDMERLRALREQKPPPAPGGVF